MPDTETEVHLTETSHHWEPALGTFSQFLAANTRAKALVEKFAYMFSIKKGFRRGNIDIRAIEKSDGSIILDWIWDHATKNQHNYSSFGTVIGWHGGGEQSVEKLLTLYFLEK